MCIRSDLWFDDSFVVCCVGRWVMGWGVGCIYLGQIKKKNVALKGRAVAVVVGLCLCFDLGFELYFDMAYRNMDVVAHTPFYAVMYMT